MLALLLSLPALGHDVRPGYLSLTERAPGQFDILFKVPASGESQLALIPQLPANCRETTGRDWQALAGATVERWSIECGTGGIESGEVAIAGLELTLTDVLLHVEWSDGSRLSTVLRPEAASIRPQRGGDQASVPVAGFLRLGIEHILGGIDHLLFVLCLVLLVDGAKRLLATITAFTLAHSVTLALATLGLVRVPSAPVEASIALSIVLLAVELVRRFRGDEEGMTVRRPWLVSFLFGLLHGLGFAGALSEVGLPAGDIPLALFLFNVGVELGQIAFVAVVLGILALGGSLIRRGTVPVPRWTPLLPAYAIGCVSAAWLLERVVAMF